MLKLIKLNLINQKEILFQDILKIKFYNKIRAGQIFIMKGIDQSMKHCKMNDDRKKIGK